MLISVVPLLTVVIPSYRRVEKLNELVYDLAAAQKQRPFRVIIINDNGPQEAFDAIKAYATECLSDLEILRNAENIGIDRNIDRCLSAAETKFVMAIGDDDRVDVKNFETLLDHLATADADLLITEYSYICDDLSLQKTNVIDWSETADLSSPEGKKTFLFERGTKLGFLGSIVFRTQAYQDNRDAEFLGTWFNHVGTALCVLFSETTKTRYFATPVVLNRAGDLRVTSWSHQAFDVIDGWWRMMALSCKKHGKATLEEYRANKTEITFQYDSFLWMLSRRSEGLIHWKSLPTLFETFDLSSRTKLLYYTTCVAPVSVCLGLKKLARAAGK